MDAYDISAHLVPGENLIAARVDYGWSTYQTIAGRRADLDVIDEGGRILAASGADTRAVMDAGHRWNAPKRNVNLGFMEIRDMRLSPAHWQRAAQVSWRGRARRRFRTRTSASARARCRCTAQCVKPPVRICDYRLVKDGCQQVSVNTRAAFFPGRRDADETVFSGFLGAVIEADRDMSGRIAFPTGRGTASSATSRWAAGCTRWTAPIATFRFM